MVLLVPGVLVIVALQTGKGGIIYHQKGYSISIQFRYDFSYTSAGADDWQNKWKEETGFSPMN